MMVIWKLLIASGVFFIGCRVIKELDQEFAGAARCNQRAAVAAYIAIIITAFVDGKADVLSAFFWGTIVLAAYSDFCTTEVYDLVYLPAFLSGMGEMVLNREALTMVILVELVIFIVLQLLLFRHFYGLSDVIAFSVCAVWLAASGGTLVAYFTFMSLTYGLLIMVQLCKGNINRKLRLKEPTAMIPYIVAALILIQIFGIT